MAGTLITALSPVEVGLVLANVNRGAGGVGFIAEILNVFVSLSYVAFTSGSRFTAALNALPNSSMSLTAGLAVAAV